MVKKCIDCGGEIGYTSWCYGSKKCVICGHTKYNFITKGLLVKEYSKNEKSTRKIAKQIGCSYTVIRDRLIKYYIPRRTCSQKGRIVSLNSRDGRTLKKYYCLDCGNEITFFSGFYGQGRCHPCANKHRFKNPENHPMFGVHRFGKEAPNYINGSSFEPYPLEFNEELKESIRQRDNHQCQKCDKKQFELKGFYKKLSIHHIDYDKTNLNPNNLISLCVKCNSEVNRNRDYWFAYFTYVIEDYYAKKIF